MSEYIEFKYDFIERTIKNIYNYTGEYEITNLMNCAVGLLMIPQSLHYENLLELDICDISEDFAIRKSDINYIKPEREDLRGVNYTEFNLRNVVNHMRNSIAHGRVKQETVTEGVIESLEFIDMLVTNVTLNMTISVDRFKRFSVAVAKMIIENRD